MLRSLHGRTQRPHNLTLCAPWRCALLGSQMLVRLVALLVAVVATQADEAPTTTGTTGFLASALASMTEVVPASASTVGVLTSTQAAMEQNKNRKRTHEPAVEPPHASAGVAVQAGTTGQPARKKRQAKGADVRLERTKRAAALGLSTKIRALTDAVEAVCGREARNNAERSIFSAKPKLTVGAQQDIMLSLLENARTASPLLENTVATATTQAWDGWLRPRVRCGRCSTA